MKQIIHKITEQKGKLVSDLYYKDVSIPKESSLTGDQILVKVLAVPINPTDVLTITPAGSKFNFEEVDGKLTQNIDENFMKAYEEILGSELIVGSEYAGQVVATGPDAKHLQGKIISSFGSAASNYVVTSGGSVLPHGDGVNIKHACAALINPLTALGMFDTVKNIDKHDAVIHTAAASNLGKMLIKICNKEKYPIVCIVRNDDQVKELKELGADYALNSKSPTFEQDLYEAIKATNATACLDAIGGGPLNAIILGTMEQVQRSKLTPAQKAATPSKYGTNVMKTIYVYGGLDLSNISIPRTMGFAFSIQGFLVTYYMQTLAPEKVGELFKYVAENLETLFASGFGAEVEFEDFLKKEVFEKAIAMKSGLKTVLFPNGKEALKGASL
eukprot:augustus_masked-scaffold_2-processed-gene-8.45-mRNA-1 protein AED:1.00 eAED:1.00 QI:0/-1/0/0/-1/1/1/0/386